MAKSKGQHVVPHEAGWAVKGERNKKATSVHDTQREAIREGRKVAKNSGAELYVHGKNGQIRERDSHGADSPTRKG